MCYTVAPPACPARNLLESKVNVVVAFNGRLGLLDECSLSVSKCLQGFRCNLCD